MADSYLNLVNYAGDESGKYLRASEFAINRALAIDDRIGEAYASLASLRQFQGKPEQAEAAFKKSIELSPNYALAYHRYSFFLRGNLLRLDEALALAERAWELDPRAPAIGGNLGLVYEEKGLYSRAEQQFQKLVAMDPHYGGAHSDLAFLYTTSITDFPKALEHAYRAIELNPEIGFWRRIPFLIYLELGDFSAAGDYLEQMRETEPGAGIEEVLLHFYRKDTAAARASVDASQYKHARMGMVELALGDADRARQIYLELVPDLLDPGQWPELLRTSDKYACAISWVLMHTGDEALGEQLLQESITFFDEQLVQVHEHVDHFWPDLCYLTAGDRERGLSAIEARLERNDLFHWEFLRLPMYDVIRDEPRFQAAVRERDRRVTIQRDSIEASEHSFD
jgi:tetratricopeptide (TPR) repeat protein